jgi:hypothetical protein
MRGTTRSVKVPLEIGDSNVIRSHRARIVDRVIELSNPTHKRGSTSPFGRQSGALR